MKYLFAAFAGTVCALGATPALADTLIDNVDGITVNEDGNVERFNAIVIAEDGRVREVLSRKSDKPKDIDYRVDGQGRVMLPGFVDAHAHVMSIGIAAMTLDLAETNSLAEALAAIKAFADANPGRPWILGRGWNQEKWGLGRFPTAAEIDAVVPDRPVWLGRIDGHAAWANSEAMKRAGVTAASESPAGGRIIRKPGSREPEGVFVDAAEQLVSKVVPAPRPEDLDVALRKAQEILFADGVTAAADMGTTIQDWQTFRRAGDVGALKLRIMAYADSVGSMELIAGPEPTPWLYQDRLRLNGIKLYMDGALGSRGALLKQPYHDEGTHKGLPLVSPAQLRNLMSRAASDGFQAAIHAIGDEANAQVLAAIEELSEAYAGDRRWRIEHAQIVDPQDIARFGRHGIIASMQPVHQTSDRVMAEARLGPDRLGGAYAWRSIAAVGSPLAFGSDAPVELTDVFAGYAAAISRTDAAGEPFGGWLPQEAVSREAALAAFTYGGAYAGFAEGRFGRLVAGERADFILVDTDPLLATPAELRQTRVFETWIGGERVYQAR
ncbi:amidohydrolase [Altererythrobacter arenosus]|uniref:Amidohydrolase n=1 Tax=Altererythrobacter arenosus TaxID=3032592 RepID=A0ABY8FSN8_9SPHN|nr:amidohydrolase [Altererythrobacter sp. CAU 1644]WFL78028.1 amidohydrolase [Altererythrobacter sp. CAU 1644]